PQRCSTAARPLAEHCLHFSFCGSTSGGVGGRRSWCRVCLELCGCWFGESFTIRPNSILVFPLRSSSYFVSSAAWKPQRPRRQSPAGVTCFGCRRHGALSRREPSRIPCGISLRTGSRCIWSRKESICATASLPSGFHFLQRTSATSQVERHLAT